MPGLRADVSSSSEVDSEAEVVHQGLGSELIASSRSDHFMVKKLPELLDHILAKLEA